jgi:LysM repeat protein
MQIQGLLLSAMLALAEPSAVPPVQTSVVTAAPAAVDQPAPPTVKRYEIQSGDSLSLIAHNHQLESWRPLWNANPELTDPDVIHPGESLVIPTDPVPDRPLPAKTTPVAAPAPSTQTPASSRARVAAPANHAPGAPGIFARIRQLESGGNYAINTGNGYYGAYQFDLQTWRGVGGSGLPSDASPEEQDMRAQMLYQRRGCNPWPNTCG